VTLDYGVIGIKAVVENTYWCKLWLSLISCYHIAFSAAAFRHLTQARLPS